MEKSKILIIDDEASIRSILSTLLKANGYHVEAADSGEAGLELYEAYALTETGIVSANYPGSNKVGSVGKPVGKDDIFISDDGELIINRKFPQTSRSWR